MQRICLIEDNEDVRDVMKEYFDGLGYKIDSYQSAEDFFENRDHNFKGLYLVDWHLPGEPGTEIVSFIRSQDKFSPIFMVSAFSKKEDIVKGLSFGADDYITKPFNFDELAVRIKNAFDKYDFMLTYTDMSEIKLLREASSIIVNGTTISLTTREYIIFEKLYFEREKPVSRDALIDCFEKDDNITLRNIDVHVFSLRKKIKAAQLIIETVRGVGYQLS